MVEIEILGSFWEILKTWHLIAMTRLTISYPTPIRSRFFFLFKPAA